MNPRESTQFIKTSPKFGKIICPSRLLVCGPSLSGKSTFLKNIVKYREEIYDCKFNRIIYCSPQALNLSQSGYVQCLREQFSDLELCSELPNIDELNITADGGHKLILIDDYMLAFNKSNSSYRLLTEFSHHLLISVVVTSHNFFAGSKFQKTLSRNYSEIVLLHTRSDKLSLRNLGVQMFPENPRILIKSMAWIEKNLDNQLKYLLLDISPLTYLPSRMIIRTNIFMENGLNSPIYFIPENLDD